MGTQAYDEAYAILMDALLAYQAALINDNDPEECERLLQVQTEAFNRWREASQVRPGRPVGNTG